MDPSGRGFMKTNKEKISYNYIYKKRNFIMHASACLSAIEIIAIEFNIGIIILPARIINIINNLSYAIIGSYIFYIVNIAIPDYFEKKSRDPVIFLKVVYLINSIHDFINNLLGKYEKSLSEEDICKILNLKMEEIIEKDFSYERKHIYELIGQLNIFSIYVDPRLLKILCDIELAYRHLGMNYVIEGKTYGETFSKYVKEIVTKIEDIKKEFHKGIDYVKNNYNIYVK